MTKEKNPLPALSPCPHCGGGAEYRSFTSRGWMYKITTHYVSCAECDCRTGFEDSPAEAAEKWNRRVKGMKIEKIEFGYNPATCPTADPLNVVPTVGWKIRLENGDMYGDWAQAVREDDTPCDTEEIIHYLNTAMMLVVDIINQANEEAPQNESQL